MDKKYNLGVPKLCHMRNISTEDYIKAVYKLEREGERATTSALAEQLQLSDASVTDMVKKLSTRGFLRYERYQGVELTPRGRRMAIKIVRRHRLWEMYLVKFLGFSWDQIHDEAEQLEHVTSDGLEHALDAALGYPTVDPHGDPIPTMEGEIDTKDGVPLATCPPGSVVRIRRVSDDNSKILQHATRLGMALNTKLMVKEKLAFDGSMVVLVNSKRQYISQRVAESIFVQPA
jgi:DtxR family Mn-dependent transcriptional regulator